MYFAEMRFAGTLAYEPRADAMALAVGLSWDPTPRLWKNACMPGSSTACCANTGVAIAVDNIAAKLRSLKLVMAESIYLLTPVHTMRGPLIERVESVL